MTTTTINGRKEWEAAVRAAYPGTYLRQRGKQYGYRIEADVDGKQVGQFRPKMTPAMKNALSAAAAREKGALCPIKGLNGMLHAAAQRNLISAMVRRGYVDYNGGVPLITQAGREALAATR